MSIVPLRPEPERKRVFQDDIDPGGVRERYSDSTQRTKRRKAVEIKQAEAAIEAILFTMGESVELERIANAIEQDKETTRKIIYHMMDQYRSADRGIQILELEDSYQLCTKKELYEYLIRVAKQPKKAVLSDVVMETLSIIAYKQPVTKLELEKIRGVKCDHAVNKLIEYNLVKELGRLDAPGRPLMFGTTEEFLRHFGVNSLDDLPEINPVQVEDFKAEAEEEIQMKLDV
jgi:segregation and condensation protein B